MTIILRPEQEQVLQDAIKSGLAHTPDEALNKAIDALREQLPHEGPPDQAIAAAARRLGTFGKQHRLSLEGLSVKDLLRESRP
jgi:hypothetical protein